MGKVIKFKPARKKSKNKGINRITKNILRLSFLFILLAIILYELYYLVIDTSYFEIKKITVKGNSKISTKEILKIANIYPGMKIFSLDKKAVKSRIESLVWVKQAKIDYEAFGEVAINIEQRKPTSIIYTGKIFYEVDDSGVIIKSGLKTIDDTLTIITGIPISKPLAPGDKIDSDRLIIALDLIKKLGDDSLSNISEINLKNKNKIYFFSLNGIKIFPGDVNRFKKLYSKVLNKIFSTNEKNKKIEYIDFRHGNEIVYKYSG